MTIDYLNLLEQNKVISTERLILRPFTDSDALDVFEYAKDELTVKYLTWSRHESIAQSLFAIQNFYQSPGTYAITLKHANKCIGCFDLRLDLVNEKASFGYVLNRHDWGHGYMTEVLDCMLKLCFDTLKLNRVESTYYIGNEGSGRVMKKCGMIEEGRALREVKIKGQFFDVVHMAKLKC